MGIGDTVVLVWMSNLTPPIQQKGQNDGGKMIGARNCFAPIVLPHFQRRFNPSG